MININESDKYRIIKSKNFNVIEYNEIKNESEIIEGWKIHVSANLDNYIEILDKVSKILIENNVVFKWINNYKLFFENISKNGNRISAGKFITIYPKDNKQFYALLEKLYIVLKNYIGPSINTDRQYKDCKVLYYRYGAFSKKSKLICKKAYYTQPNYVIDKFEKNINKVSNLIDNKYEVLDILKLDNSGGVYLSKNIEDNKMYIIKEAKEFIYFEPEKTVIELRKNEMKHLIKFKNFSFIPNYIDNFYEIGSFFLIIEYIDKGESLREYFDKYNLSKCKQKKDYKKFNKNVLNIMKQSFEIINKINKKGYLIEDISEENFIISDEKVYFVDLELCSIINNNKVFCKRKESKLFNEKVVNFENRDKVKLGFMFLKLIVNYNKKYPLNEYLILWLNILKYIIEKFELSNEIYDIIYDNIKYNYKNFKINKSYKLKLVKPKEIKQTDLEYAFLKSETKIYNKKIKFILKSIIKELSNNKINVNDIIKLIILNRYKDNIEFNVELYFKNYKNKYLKNNNFKYKEYYLPYIIGLAGIILLEIELNNKITKDVKILIKNIDSNYINKINFEFGITGLIYLYYKLYILENKKTYLNKMKMLSELLDIYFFDIKVQNNLKKEKNNFFKGMQGINYVKTLIGGLKY